MRAWLPLFLLLAASVLASPAAATIDAQSDGSDGALNVTTADLTIDLGQAVTGTWNQPGTGVGVYDSTKWAVVFKYSSINIASGRTVKFINHPSNAPVVWLVQGVATIAGTVSLDGENGLTNVNRESLPGPGGFPGGRPSQAGSPATAGHGPGGGPTTTDYRVGGAYATTSQVAGGMPYGNARILPLIGGSGGGGCTGMTYSGGAGGGAILIVVGQRFALTGLVSTLGGRGSTSGSLYSGGGSGGAIRVVADTLAGGGSMSAFGSLGYAGNGRIRLETNVLTYSNQTSPAYSLQLPLGPEGVVIWPPAPEPTVRIATVNGQPVTADPRMNPAALVGGDLTISATSSVPVTVAAANVPTSATVTIRVGLGAADAYTVPATFVSGDASSSIWSATLTSLSPARVSSLQAKAVLP
jgi:hypothetical protein